MTAKRRVLSTRELNRALLERQMLLRRRRVPVPDAVERLVAMQAQVPRDPYVALWSRLDRFRPESLSTLLEDRRAVRMTLLRGTLHLVSARDARALRPVVQPVMERGFFAQRAFRESAEGVDVDEVVAFLRAQLDEGAWTRAELADAIAGRWPDRDAHGLSHLLYWVPTMQVTPRGLWGRSARPAFTSVEHWLGEPIGRSTAPDEMLLRYLTAFGPATVADAQAWSGLSGLAPSFERLRRQLRTFEDERGRELYDVPSAPLPDPATPAPVRFLPEYDNAGLAFKDRTRIIPPELTLWTEVGWAAILVDGFVAARWRLETEKARATLTVETFRRLTRAERTETTEEAERLLAFLTDGAGSGAVRIAG